MPQPLPAALAQVQATWQISGQPEIAVQSFWFYQGTTTFDETKARVLANAVSTFQNSFGSYLQAMTLQRIAARATDHSVASGGDWAQEWVFPDITRSISGGAGAGLPNQVAIVLSLITTKPGRSGRGRLYMGPLSGTVSSSSGAGVVVATPAITALNNAATALRTAAAANGTPWVVFSRTQQLMTPVASTRVGDRFDTQRRRRSAFKEIYTVSS